MISSIYGDKKILCQHILKYLNTNDDISLENLILYSYLLDNSHCVRHCTNIDTKMLLMEIISKIDDGYRLHYRLYKNYDLDNSNLDLFYTILYKNNTTITEENVLNEVNKYLSLEPDILYDKLVEEGILIPNN